MFAALTSVRDPHHHARGFDRACHCNIMSSAVVEMTSNGINSVINLKHGATEIDVMILS